MKNLELIDKFEKLNYDYPEDFFKPRIHIIPRIRPDERQMNLAVNLIKSSKNTKNFKLVSVTENRVINKKISGLKIELNSVSAFKNTDVIIDFTVPKCTLEVLKIASKLKKKSGDWHNWIFQKRGKYN